MLKSEVVSIGMSRNRPIPEIVCLDGHPVKLSPSINYLGLPIRRDLKHTRALSLEFLGAKLRKAYGLFVPCKARKRRMLSKIYDVFLCPVC